MYSIFNGIQGKAVQVGSPGSTIKVGMNLASSFNDILHNRAILNIIISWLLFKTMPSIKSYIYAIVIVLSILVDTNVNSIVFIIGSLINNYWQLS